MPIMDPICPAYLKAEGKPCEHYQKVGLCNHPMFFRCIEFCRRHEPILSYSSMQDFICPRKFYLSYIKGYEEIEKPLPMRLGLACSKTLDQLHSDEKNIEKVDVRTLFQWNGPLDEDGFYDFRVEALISVMQAYVELGKHMNKGKTQAEFRYQEPEMPKIHGFIDLLQYQDNIGWEFKYTQRPEAYKKFTLQDQLSTYFLAHQKVQQFTVRTILNPIGTLRLGKNEKVEVFRERVYADVLARPKHYFEDRSYWRNEFDLDQHKEKIKQIARDIMRYIEEGSGQMINFRQVNTPYTCFLQSEYGAAGPCEFLTVCETGIISETVYKRRGGKKNEQSSELNGQPTSDNVPF